MTYQLRKEPANHHSYYTQSSLLQGIVLQSLPFLSHSHSATDSHLSSTHSLLVPQEQKLDFVWASTLRKANSTFSSDINPDQSEITGKSHPLRQLVWYQVCDTHLVNREKGCRDWQGVPEKAFLAVTKRSSERGSLFLLGTFSHVDRMPRRAQASGNHQETQPGAETPRGTCLSTELLLQRTRRGLAVEATRMGCLLLAAKSIQNLGVRTNCNLWFIDEALEAQGD